MLLLRIKLRARRTVRVRIVGLGRRLLCMILVLLFRHFSGLWLRMTVGLLRRVV